MQCKLKLNSYSNFIDSFLATLIIYKLTKGKIETLQVYASFYVARKTGAKGLQTEVLARIPKLMVLAILRYFSVWCSFIPYEKTSTQKLSHSFYAG